jgi:hypothetical protein
MLASGFMPIIPASSVTPLPLLRHMRSLLPKATGVRMVTLRNVRLPEFGIHSLGRNCFHPAVLWVLKEAVSPSLLIAGVEERTDLKMENIHGHPYVCQYTI